MKTSLHVSSSALCGVHVYVVMHLRCSVAVGLMLLRHQVMLRVLRMLRMLMVLRDVMLGLLMLMRVTHAHCGNTIVRKHL